MARLALLAPLVMAFIGSVTAATNAFIQVTQTTGQPISPPLNDFAPTNIIKNAFAIQDYSFEVENTMVLGAQAPGASAGKPVFDAFSFTRPVDANSPGFFTTLAKGIIIDTVVLSIFGAGPATANPAATPIIIYTFNTVLLTSQTVQNGDESPSEKISFQYGKLTVSSAPRNADGTLGKPVVGSWNRISNAPNKVRGMPYEA